MLQPVGALLATQAAVHHAGNVTERVWIIVNYSKDDGEPAGHVLYMADFVGAKQADETTILLRSKKYHISYRAHCSQFVALKPEVSDPL